jgi:hypothetical protein
LIRDFSFSFFVKVRMVVEFRFDFASFLVCSLQVVHPIPIFLYACKPRLNFHNTTDNQTYQVFLHKLLVRLRLADLDCKIPWNVVGLEIEHHNVRE